MTALRSNDSITFGMCGRRSSLWTFWWSTGNDVSGHFFQFFSPSRPFLIEGMQKLTGVPKTLPDPLAISGPPNIDFAGGAALQCR